MNKKLYLLIFCSSILILIAGLTSDLSLGDEVVHYRFAKDIFNSGRRVAFDQIYASGYSPGYSYNSEPLWHIVLATLWRLYGKISFPIAQIYQVIFYALIILFTYLLGKEIYGPERGLISALIIATVPAIIAFSMVFYLDVPVTALSVLCFLLIIKKRFFCSGIVLGLIWLTKRNPYFFIPAFIYIIFGQTKNNFRSKVANLAYFVIPPFFFILPDMLWRENNLKADILTVHAGKIVKVPGGGNLEWLWDRFSLRNLENRMKEYLNSSLFNPADIIKYFGIILLLALILYVIFKRYEKKDHILWIAILSYYLFFCWAFFPGSDIRYILPIFPILAILTSKAIADLLHRKWAKVLIIFLSALQFAGTTLYVREKRQIPAGIREGFDYLKKNTPPDSLIIYPEAVILEGASRRFGWAGRLQPALYNLFWNKDDVEVKKILKDYNIDYIAIKKSRFYDDAKVHHYGGYPKSFLERLPKSPNVKLIFDNKEMSIWQVK